ncbi:MAG TPA: reverse transcriptase family protein [Patescibacteria group bacterium]|nr:reverse transcriptase family protein [Patescibacteria group bacterium]
MSNNTIQTPILSIKRLCDIISIPPAKIEQICNNIESYYKPFDVYKGKREDGSDKWRHIDNPVGDLKLVQDRINKNILKPVSKNLPDFLTGGMPGRSILKNASFHLDKPMVITLDIANCFPSITDKMIFDVWRKQLNCSPKVSSVLTRLSTINFNLPQGSPASPILCNLTLYPLANAISKKARQKKVDFTIYMDDITLSGDKKPAQSLIADVIKIVSSHNLRISKEDAKFCILGSNYMQEITGLIVNQKPNIQRQKIESIRREIIEVSNNIHTTPSYVLNTLWGKITFLRAINEQQGEKMVAFANLKLGSENGIPKIAPSHKRRVCKSYKNVH